MERIAIKNVKNREGKSARLAGWVDVRRDHGKLVFIDLRDSSGKVQMVVVPKNKEAHSVAQEIRPEWVIEVEGKVNKRPANMANPRIPLGDIEIEVEKINVLNKSHTPPFEIGEDGYGIGEEARLEYRYLDLRRERMQKNLKIRHEIIKYIRDYLSDKGFIEVETPLLTRSTPEGARDFIVPSRLRRGKFYALPQSPQQYKQLLMAGGLEKYFQIARCLRDEDTRGDRQPEFTQLDLEMSFVGEEEVMNIIEGLILGIAKEFFPQKKVYKSPFPREKYGEVIKKHKSDKPDIRKRKTSNEELAFLWITDFPLFEYSKEEKRLVSVHHPFTSPHEEDLKILDKNPEKAKSRAYDLVLNGEEIGGGSVRIHSKELQEKIFDLLGIEEKQYKKQFGHMLSAFEYGTPPHAGIALGLDRLIAIILDEPNIREVIAFPKTGDARDLMMDAPGEVSKSQLDELGIEIKKENKEK